MIKLLVDTCVWLDLAKDHRQQTFLSALEELIRAGEVSIILPQTVVDVRNAPPLRPYNGWALETAIRPDAACPEHSH